MRRHFAPTTQKAPAPIHAGDRPHPHDRAGALQQAADASAVVGRAAALQRSADTAVLRRIALPQPQMPAADGRPIQRVGEAKADISPQPVPINATIAEAYRKGQERLDTAATETDAERKRIKNTHWAEVKRRSESPDKNQRKGISGFYAGVLSQTSLATLLPRHRFFGQDPTADGWTLNASWAGGAGEGDQRLISEIVSLTMPGKRGKTYDKTYHIKLATLEPRAFTALTDQPAEARRTVFSGGKGDKEYVEDMLGVKTRRYAYVEKNYFQMMEFFASGHMEGRFQSLMRAKTGDARPDVHKRADPGFIGRFQIAGKGGDLTGSELAYVHQYLGSSDHQRGLSLTSTPRLGETIGNAGENFRSNDGFRLKIDLARIPTDEVAPILINHYAAGGNKDRMDEFNPVNASGKKPYKYTESVTKNREVYLEFLKPEYVVEIEYHPDKSVEAVPHTLAQPGGGESTDAMIRGAKRASGFGKYDRGFSAALAGRPKLDSASATWKKGWDSGREYLDAYDATPGPRPNKAPRRADAFGDPDRPPPSRDEHTAVRIGRIHAHRGRARITSLAEMFEP